MSELGTRAARLCVIRLRVGLCASALFVLLGTWAGTAQAQVDPSDLVAWWELNDTSDSAPSGTRPLTLQDGAALVDSGGDGGTHVPFLKNTGQVDSNVAFYATGAGATTFVTTDGAIKYLLPDPDNDRALVIEERLIDARTTAIEGTRPGSSKVSSFRGSEPDRWRSNIPSFHEIEINEIYNGIDLVLAARTHHVEKLFHVAPGSDPEVIRMSVEGADRLRVTDDGRLELDSEIGAVSFSAPVAFQEIDGHRQFVDVTYDVRGATYGFELGRYDTSRPLVIDPILASTLLGGSGADLAPVAVFDSDGNLWLTGATASTDFPTTAGAYSPTSSGADDLFIAKLKPDLTTLLAATYFGGSGVESNSGLALDSNGNVYLSGRTDSTDLPVTPGVFQTTLNGVTDAFIAKFDPSLGNLLASTYLRGSEASSGSNTQLMIDTAPATDEVVLAFSGASANFPATAGAFDTTYNDIFGPSDDVMVARMSNDLTTLIAGTYLGGDLWDVLYKAILDASGNVYLAGRASSSNFPTTAGAYDTTPSGNTSQSDCFVSVLSADLSTLNASTILGVSEGVDIAFDVALGSLGEIFVAGSTASTTFPTTAGAFQTTNAGLGDGFIAQFDSGLTTLLASTFLGGTNFDRLLGIAIDGSGNVHVGGHTRSSDFPTTTGAFDEIFNSADNTTYDAIYTILDANLTTLQESTFIGGVANDVAQTPIFGSNGHTYLSGYTESTDFPVAANAYDSTLGGTRDAFVVIPKQSGSPPLIEGVSPSSGPTAGGTLITIAGSDFVDGAHVRVGGRLAPGVTFINSGNLEARTPSGTTGAADVTVINPDFVAGTFPGGFTYECTAATAPTLLAPASDATTDPEQVVLEWTAAAGDFRYAVLLDASDTPTTVIARDLAPVGERGRFVVSNLEPGTDYSWRVVAKQDTACGTGTQASAVSTFKTFDGCAAPDPFARTSPFDGAPGVLTSTTLKWEAAAGAGVYDVFFGADDAPGFFRSTQSNSFPVSGLEEGTTYYWAVVARASCDRAKTTRLALASFTVTGACGAPEAVTLVSPGPDAPEQPISLTLSWSASAGATSYDLYFGPSDPPPLRKEDLTETEVEIAGLDRGQTYYWKVVAKAACDDSETVSETRSFTTASACTMPGATSFTSTPSSVGARQLYPMGWRRVADLGIDGYYEIERSTASNFIPLLDTQRIRGTSATFFASTTGTIYHRVRAVPGCDPEEAGPPATAVVNVTAAPPNVIFTRLPKAVVVRTGSDLEGISTRAVIENISEEAVDVSIGSREIDSEPFFTVDAPISTDGVLSLEPGVPVALGIDFVGVDTSSVSSYQGLIYLSATGSDPLPVTPFARVSLTVGDDTLAQPEILVEGAESSFVAFPPFAGDDETRDPITIQIHNPGAGAMSLASEVGPDLWLVPESGWDATPLAAGETRDVMLYTDRTLAPAGSALPRYTGFTVRTSVGRSARVVVQDQGVTATESGRTELEPGESSKIIPDVVSGDVGSVPYGTWIRLTNLSGDPVTAELIFTPTGESGFSSSKVVSTALTIPGRDGVTLTDPLVSTFGLVRPAQGQLEVRADRGAIDRLQVRAGVSSAPGSRRALGLMPVVGSGEGARAGAPHILPGIELSALRSTAVVLAETTGRRATVELALTDANGTAIGQQSYLVERYGHMEIGDVVTELGGGPITGGRLTLTVTDGTGAVIGVAKRGLTSGVARSTIVSRPATDRIAAAGAQYRRASKAGGVEPMATTTTLVVPLVVQGPIDSSSSESYQTIVGFVAPAGAAATFDTTFTSTSGSTLTKSLMVSAGQTVEHTNVLADFFLVTTADVGAMTITADSADAQVYSALIAGSTQSGSVPVIGPTSELFTSSTGTSQPVHYDGMEQSTDPNRGTRWNLYIQETGGQSGKVRISIYEAGNRSSPLLEKDFPVAASSTLALETVFGAVGLESELRKKDRTGVLCVVRPTEGDAVVTASAIEIDNTTGAAQVHPLEPGTGLSSSLVTVTTVGGLGGDANGDGAVSVTDIFYLINHLFASGPAPLGSGDANGDGAVSVTDIFYLINHIFAGGPPPV